MPALKNSESINLRSLPSGKVSNFLPEEKSRCTFFVSYVGGPWQAAPANIEINSLRKEVVPNYFVLL